MIALDAPSFGIVALSRGENVNAAWLVIAAVCIYLIAYRLKGDLLMVIDPTNYNIAVSRDAAAVQQAQANMENAAKDAKRRQELSDLAVIKGSAAEMPPAHLRLARSGWRKQLRIIHRGRSFQEDNPGPGDQKLPVYRVELHVTDDAHPMTLRHRRTSDHALNCDCCISPNLASFAPTAGETTF